MDGELVKMRSAEFFTSCNLWSFLRKTEQEGVAVVELRGDETVDQREGTDEGDQVMLLTCDAKDSVLSRMTP